MGAGIEPGIGLRPAIESSGLLLGEKGLKAQFGVVRGSWFSLLEYR